MAISSTPFTVSHVQFALCDLGYGNQVFSYASLNPLIIESKKFI